MRGSRRGEEEGVPYISAGARDVEGGEGEVAGARARGRRRWGSDRAEGAAVRAASGRSDAGEEKAARVGAMRGWRYPGRSWGFI